jgi:hypothetical protein
VVDKLAKHIGFATPELRDWSAKNGAGPMSMTQPEFASFVLSENERAARIMKSRGSNLNKREDGLCMRPDHRLLGTWAEIIPTSALPIIRQESAQHQSF